VEVPYRVVIGILACILFSVYQYRKKQEIRDAFKASQVIQKSSNPTIVIEDGERIEFINQKALKIFENEKGAFEYAQKLLAEEVQTDVEEGPWSSIKDINGKEYNVKISRLSPKRVLLKFMIIFRVIDHLPVRHSVGD
jgi:hypothetical protein